MKSENYSLLGGINTKVSQYNNSPLEFLNITNLDFQTVGALSQRWGSTQYIGQTFPGRINSLYEYSRLSGSSYIVTSYSGGIWYGATTGQYQGMSLSVVGITRGLSYDGAGNRNTIYSLDKGLGSTAVQITYVAVNIPTYGITSYPVVTDQNTSRAAEILSDNKLSYAVLNNYLFMADGNKFLKFDGTTTTPVGLPPCLNGLNFTASFMFGLSGPIGDTLVGVGIGGGASFGAYGFYASYVNNRGFESQIWPIGFVSAFGSTNIPLLGGTFIRLKLTAYIPIEYGISTINVYSYCYQGFSGTNQTLNRLNMAYDWWNAPYVKLASVAANGSTFQEIDIGTTTGGMGNLFGNVGALADPTSNTYYNLGVSTYATAGGTVFYDINSYYPRYVEVFQNRLFCAGFSSTPSTVWFSDTGEPEGFPLENNFEVRTNDADVITAMKAYNSRLYIFKKNSFYVLLGDTTSNFNLQEHSVIYGCLNNRCVETYDNYMVFLDRNGLMLFNASNISCLSNKVQSFFDRMNYNAALTEACVVHDKLRNQILVAIPIDGSTVNNITMVYDYLAGAWTTYNGYSVSVFATIQGYNNTKNVFYGSHSGTINWFGPSFLSDNGVGFTSYFKTRFLHDMGESIEKQFRRLYLNADTGTTFTMPINFFQDYGASTVYQTTFVLSEFQKRIDYGIPAKSLAFELYNLNTNSPLRIYGFTIESRMQRRV